MSNNKPYAVKPDHLRKLRALGTEEVNHLKAAQSSWQNGNWKEAKAAAVSADHAHAKWFAFFNKLVGWQENGVPQQDYAI